MSKIKVKTALTALLCFVITLFFLETFCIPRSSAAGEVWTSADNNTSLNINTSVDASTPTTVTFNGKLYTAWVEGGKIRVKMNDGSGGSGWSLVDNGGLNFFASGHVAYNPSFAVFSNKLYVAWHEQLIDYHSTVIHVRRYDGGSAWTLVDPEVIRADGVTVVQSDGGDLYCLNHICSAYAERPVMADFNGALYVVWSESYNGVYQLRVRKYDGANWIWMDHPGFANHNTEPPSGDVLTGLNKNTAYSAYRPHLAVFGGALYVTWRENNGTADQIRVQKYNGSTWSFVDGNAATGLNFNMSENAENPMLQECNGKLYLVWQEVFLDGGWELYKIRAMKSDDGSSWTRIDGGGAGGFNKAPNDTSAKDPALFSYNNLLFLTWDEEYDNGTDYIMQIRMAKYDGSSLTFIDGNGSTGLNYDVNKNAEHPAITVLNHKMYLAWDESNGTKTQVRAKMLPFYSVTYNGNGSDSGSPPTDSKMYTQNTTVTVLGNTGNLAKTGCTFAGWNTAANGSGTNYTSGNTFAMGAANVTLYAKWTANNYTVTYDGNGSTGGSPPTDSNTYHYNDTVTVLGNTGNLAKTGCTFAGWNTAANGSGTNYTSGNTFAMGAANVTLYARWTPTLTSYSNSGHTQTCDNFSSSNNTVYIGGSGFEASTDYHVAYYDGAGDKLSSDGITSNPDCSLSSALSLAGRTGANTDNPWHAVVYKDPAEPASSYNAGDPNIIAQIFFTVQPSAIPEFPTILTPVAVIGMCSAFYWWIKKRKLARAG